MEAALTAEQEQRISETVERERGRLGRFIRSRVANSLDAEDVLQDVFHALLTAGPLEQVTAWLYRTASNRIIDLFRKKKPETLPAEEWLRLEELLPSPDAGPDAVYARGVLLEEVEAAIDELPPEQRDVFIAHEVYGKSFKEIAAESGVGINTLLSRKHYAVLHLRERLREIYEEFGS
ncbi:MAG TPA: RNA polymerase sigma factor [Thermoanaerobaculia bacterium]|nr:RNA polymerase sigma factor [Thermoanaerobaculia bacterium]